MLKLKKLQILGFKSFCDRTELKFPGDGVAAIVGPNGCGKSNISDAIAWVLGEQSAKTLRGARMEDVIFAGTRDRKPTGMAEVSLTLIDPDVYDGDSSGETEIEIRDAIPAEDDWDEAALRESAAKDTDEYQEEVQPHKTADGLQPTADGVGPQDGNVAQPPSAVAAIDGQAEANNEQPATSDDDTATGREPSTVDAAQTQHPAVVLRIRRRKFKQNFKAGEIVVTRRLFRSGDSEYLLNGKLCRLRDIQDIFMGTGLGPESYAIIEQGRIGQILSSKPTDRRAIIEEAAGITKFKTRKRLAEARLEEAKLNLNRVNDIFEEVTRQMNSLKRQAAKAERYARLRDEMRDKLRLVLASKLAQLRGERAAVEAELERLSEDLRLRGEFVQSLESENSEATQRGYAVDNEARENRERLSAINLAADRASARQRTNEERCSELVVRIDSAATEIDLAQQKLTALEMERELNRSAVESAEAEVAAAQQEAAERQQEASAAAAALAEVETQQEQRRRQVMLAVAETAAVHNHIARAQEHIAGLDRELRRLNTELEAARQQVEVFGGQRGQIAFEFETASQKVSSVAAQIDLTRTALGRKREEEGESRKMLDILRAEYATALGRRSSLEAVIAEHGYSTESVKRLFQSGALHDGFAPAGVLADFLEVDDRYEHVVEDFLRDELNYIVVKSWDAADEGLRMLRTDVDGRATFLVHPSDSQARFSFTVDELAHQAPRREHAVTPLKNCIRVLNGFGKSLEVVLPKLRDGYIVPDPFAARDLALENPDAFFLSESGECFHNVTVTGGKQRSEGPLSLKRELRDILRHITEIEEALRREERRAALLAREISELTSLLDRLENERREADKAAMTSGHNLKQLESEMERVRGRMDTYQRELLQVSSDRAASESRAAEKQTELAACEQRKAALEREAEAAQESLGGLRFSRDAAVQAASEVKARLAALEERSRAAAQALARLDAQVVEMNQRLQALNAQRESAITENAQREAENAQIVEQLATLAGEREQAQLREEELQRLSDEIRQRLGELEEELKAARLELDAVRDRRGETAATSARLASDEQHMGETAVNELGVPADELLADSTLVLVEGEQLAADETAYREMRAKLESMGPVNMMALEEYKEAAQRYEFLDTQRKDLLDAIDNTQKTIKEIEATCQEKFKDAFAHINENFQATFKKLFGGGQGFMRLNDEENTAESGIDVVASPPGKKLQNVLLLSGGEKALTALALLVGIFQYAPSPFCILDEVDAPLDEANVGRFTELVREMSVQTQFVLITHSKKTMSIAPVMYGVTMQEPGVSKLVSVRFNEHAHAATA